MLHAAAEVFPLVKTGGLADVVASLPPALSLAGAEVRLLLPGMPAIIGAVLHQKTVCEIGPIFGAARVTLLLGRLPYSNLLTYVIHAPYLYERGGGPYQDGSGVEWPDNLQRFALLGWVAAHLAAGELDPAWKPDLMHAHDWHAAMGCTYMAAHPSMRAASVLTVHNLAFQGLFAHADFALLGLPARFMVAGGLEFHSRLSFMKAGLRFADRITTVSPTYAREITLPEFGCGLDGVILGRGADLSGILNGVDCDIWNPARDFALAEPYSIDALEGKVKCKQALQTEMGLACEPESPLLCMLSRFTSQKGLDLVLDVLPALLRHGAQLALQGSGEPGLEAACRQVAQAYPGRVATRIGYDEAQAHRLVAGADAILVPSRFEPCGLTQMYGLRYGTLPVVRRVGGLADTVVDASENALREGRASGFVFDTATPQALQKALERALSLYRQPKLWRQVMLCAMAQDFSWEGAAQAYMALYRAAVLEKQSGVRGGGEQGA